MKKIAHLLLFIFIGIMPIATIAIPSHEKNLVYVYSDEGVSKESLTQTLSYLKTILPKNYRAQKITASEVIQNNWVKNAALIIMPGGADLPYLKKLNGQGNDNIKNFVRNGGAFLGICAGAYYGSANVQFDKGGELEVLGERELGFFPGSAIGPVLAKYHYKNNSGSRAARITLNTDHFKEVIVYYNGGGYFERAQKYKNVSILGYYQNHLPAIISISYGKGHVVLTGVHVEYNSDLLDSHDPYLKSIVADLKASEEARNALTKNIFKQLGIML